LGSAFAGGASLAETIKNHNLVGIAIYGYTDIGFKSFGLRAPRTEQRISIIEQS
jgi:hypothetical protein